MRQFAGEGRIPVLADFLQRRRFGLRDHADFVAERDQPSFSRQAPWRDTYFLTWIFMRCTGIEAV